MNGRPPNNPWDVYLEVIREHAHQLLAWAHTDVRGELNADANEPTITGLLCEAMKRRINSPESPDIYMHYAVGDQDPVSPAGQRGNDRLRLDINILRTGMRPQLAYILRRKGSAPEVFQLANISATAGWAIS